MFIVSQSARRTYYSQSAQYVSASFKLEFIILDKTH